MNDRNLGIDLIKIIACIGVVLLHTIGLSSSKYNNIIYYCGTISVPIFFMSNGYFILNKDKIDYKYLLKKITRLFYIVIFWNIIYSVIKLITKNTIDNIFIQIIKSLVEKGNIIWFWFLGALIILYIITPLLRIILKKEKLNKIFIIALIIICEIIYIINVFRGYEEKQIIKKLIPQTFRLWTWIMYYYLGGYLRDNLKLDNKNNKVLLCLLLLLTLFCILYERFIANNILHNLYAENFYDNIYVIIWNILLFEYLSNLKIKEKYRNRIIGFSSLTFGIYIIHGFIFKFIQFRYDFSNGFINIIVFGLTLVISILSSYVIKKIPYINKTIT